MKRIAIVFIAALGLLLMGAESYAQNPNALRYKGGKYLKGYDEVVDRSQFKEYFTIDEYLTVNSALKQRRAGMWTLVAGGVAIGAGLGVYLPGELKRDKIFFDYGASVPTDDPEWKKANAYFGGGIACMATGAVLLMVGSPLFCIGNARLKWAAKNYNSRNNYAVLSFNQGIDGVGLKLSF